MSSETVENAILAHWVAGCPVAEPLRAFDAFNSPPFTPPTIDPTSAGFPGDCIWIRLSIAWSQRSARPHGIGANAPRYWDGFLIQQIFFPRNIGEAAVAPIVDAARDLFHRADIGSPVVARCKDSSPPERIYPEESDPQFSQINVSTPVYVVQQG